jgi:hypothetical protein
MSRTPLATTPDVNNFGSARDYAAWLGLTPKPHSTGGKQKVGRISKMGNRFIRRLLYLGAMAQIMVRRRCGLGSDIGPLVPEKDKSARHCVGAPRGKNNFRRSPRWHALRATGSSRLSGLGMVRAK